MPAAVLLLAALSGCFDLETELRLLPDGSGFVTTWVRVDHRDALIASSIGGQGIDAEVEAAVANLKDAMGRVEGVDWVDHQVYMDGDKQVLRFRYVFDHQQALNEFWNGPAAGIPILMAGARLDFRGSSTSCGRYVTGLNIAPRDPVALFPLDQGEMGDLSDEVRTAMRDKIFGGEFRLRIVPPGVVEAADAPSQDASGYPIYQSRMMALLRNGRRIGTRSYLECGKDNPATPESTGVTVGAAPAPDMVKLVMRGLPLFVETSMELEQVDKRRANVKVVMLADEPMGDALSFYLPLLLAAFPQSAANMNLSSDKMADGRTMFTFTSKEAIDLRDANNSLVFLGKDGPVQIFRMKLPASPYVVDRPPDAPPRRIVTIRVKLLDEIRVTNATEKQGSVAIWRIDDQTLRNAVTLEAVSK
ncbi:hypothetical protein KDL45_13170 [bacterium]|nr:hypothetical protein [bacterium]